jgi:hypothetical protein
MTETTPTAPAYDPQAILNLPMDPGNDARAATIRDYLVNLLTTIWREGEDFSGKRPFGNSGWDGELIKPLVKAGVIPGKIERHGYLDDWDDQAGEAAITAAIEGLRVPSPAVPATPEILLPAAVICGLKAVIEHADYDTHKMLEGDEDGVDKYPGLVETFTRAYEAAASPVPGEEETPGA